MLKWTTIDELRNLFINNYVKSDFQSELEKILYQTSIFTVFIHFCFFAVGVLIALIIAQYSVSRALIEIANKLGGISIIVVIPQLIMCGSFKKLKFAAFN